MSGLADPQVHWRIGAYLLEECVNPVALDVPARVPAVGLVEGPVPVPALESKPVDDPPTG